MAIFSDIRTPYINDLTLKRVLSKSVRNNVFQEILFKPGEAVTEKFSEDNTDAAEIQILRIKPLPNDAREFGADKNGGWFNNQEAATSSSEAYGIKILQTIDRNIDIPTTAQDMISVDLLENEVKNLSGLVARNINASTLASMVAKNFNAIAGFDRRDGYAPGVATTAIENNWITNAGNYTDSIIDALTKLDEGNEAQGIDAYPQDQRAIIIRPTIKGEITKNMTGLYGGTAVFDILKRGGLDTTATPAVATTGYVGEIGGVPVYSAAPIVWSLAEKYLGLPAGALSTLSAVVCSGVGTGRALAFNSKIKTVDAPSGQGIRLQPKYRWGVETFDPKSCTFVFASEFTNPVTTAENALFVRGVGSRA
jgi:hypothetical protein